ncbi:PKD domain-containing protein [Candidatus Palauibacter sp.]|uniref:PKD domain-containing protein n=1 Tax=Candidatus Palauibacter sp. TaxID=3101350 RepID=UPI003B5C31AA
MRIRPSNENRHRVAFALLVAAIVTGCSERAETVAGPAPRASERPNTARPSVVPVLGGSAGATEDMAAEAWFEISIEVDGTFKPHVPMDVIVTYTARFPSAQADLRLTLPEIEFAKRSGWAETYKTRLGLEIPPVVESRTAFPAGGSETQTTVLAVPAAGIYRLHARARAAELHPEGATGRVARTTHEYLWLFVHGDGGRVLRNFDPDLIPPGFRRQPGPFRRFNETTPPARDGAAGLANSSATGDCTSLDLCFQVQYYDMDFNDQRGLPGISYELALQTPDGSRLASATGNSGEHGGFVIPCPGNAGTEFVGRGRLRLIDAKFQLSPEPNLAFVVSDDLCGQTIDLNVPGAHAKTWIDAQYAIDKSRTLFPARAPIRILINPGYSIGGRVNNCWYLWYSDEITVVEGRGGDPDCLWGRWGSFVFAHEYGHALHHTQLGGLHPLDDDCAEHYAYTPESMVCAYQEGWADYHAMRTEPVYSNPGYHYNTAEDYENNRGIKRENDGSLSYLEFTREPGPNGSRDDGSRYHGEVTAFFHDLFDPANETHDALELDVGAVMDVMASCRVSRDTVMVAPSGIDHLIWCLEARIDTTVTRDTTYFRQRFKPKADTPENFHPAAQNQDSVPWSPDHIRRLWRGNLYRLAADSTDLARPSLPEDPPSGRVRPDPGSPPLPPVANQPPVARLVVTCEVLPTCLFDGSESSDDASVTSYTWYANSVVLASGPSDTLRHTFTKPGMYGITLSVEDEEGRWNSATAPDSVVVPDQPPTASLSVECFGLECTFDASESSDDVKIESYAWHVDGDSVAAGPDSILTHMFESAGNYAVKLTVADSAEQADSLTVTVSVPNDAPVSAFTTQCSGLDCVFDASSSPDAHRIASYAWTVDGTEIASGTADSVSHTFPANGTYTVGLTVADTARRTRSRNESVSVRDDPPAASFTYSCTDFVCEFDGSGSTDDVGIVSYNWSVAEGVGGASGQTGSTFSRTFSAGTWHVTLRVADKRGQADSVTEALTFAAPDAPASGLPPDPTN